MSSVNLSDVTGFFINAVKAFKSGLGFLSPLEKIVISSSKNSLAYIDDRREALEKHSFDFWSELRANLGESEFNKRLHLLEISEKLMYSRSQKFPDFLFKVRRTAEGLSCGSLLELKDSKSGSIASFNSTIPTKSKTLREIDIINNSSLVSRIASAIDGQRIGDSYSNYERRCFYFIRTHNKDKRKVKLSIVDGSFFETVPKENLLHQVWMQILHAHVERKHLQIPDDVLQQVEKVLSNITDQTIIAASRQIEKASIKPRFRIMAEVHPEGNPHTPNYPEIRSRSFNFILQSRADSDNIYQKLRKEIPELKVFTIQHKRNGEHLVFQYNL